ncbi:prolactin receptor a isoform 1-T4 [Syngnathus typhle]
MRTILELTCLLLLSITPHAKGLSPPGKPTLTSCRSPEKETFTCWWQPGSDGGLPTTYALYYRKESSEVVHECPDYSTGGENSCFFNKNDTSIWVNYIISVVATNQLGSAFSDPVDIDVVYIVQPNPPENVSLNIMEDKGWPFLRVVWEPPRQADTRSGWITLIYELRIRSEGENEWETHVAGQQKLFNIFSLRSGTLYLVQVRCKPDHGFWSEWSSESQIFFPDYFPREKSAWIIITAFCTSIFLITWLLHMNSRSLKHCLLPPVPGPKIKGFDPQLLKKGTSKDIFNGLVLSNFPRMSSSNNEDLLVEYLEVYISEEREAMLEGSKDLDGHAFKSESSTSESSASDSDSGRGSCDSHTLLIEKCGQPKEHEDGTRAEREDWENPRVDMRDRTWTSVFTSPPKRSSHSLSDSLSQHLGPSQVCKQIKARSDVNIAASDHKLSPARWSVEYVGVQTVVEDDVVILQPRENCSPPPSFQKRDYSRVKQVGSDNMLLLLQKVSEGTADGHEGGMSFGATSQKSATMAASDYVDTSAGFPLTTS